MGKPSDFIRDLVIDVRVVEGDVAAKFVAERGGARWNLHADDEGAALGYIGVDL